VAAVAPVERFDVSRHRTHLAAEVPVPAGAPPSRRASLADRFAVAAAREAIAAAALDLDECRDRTGVYFGSSTGGMLESEWFYAAMLATSGRRGRASLLAAQQFNGPGDAVARDAGILGPVETVSSACASGAMAIGAALRALRRGDVDVALAGGSDSLCQLTYAGFNSLRAVDEAPSRPFRKDRAGLSLGEGAGVLVLETREHAGRRGAAALATLAGEAETCDAQHMTAPHPEGAGAREALERALADADAQPSEVDFVNAHGTGTPLNDAAEAAAFRAIFGDRTDSIPVTSTKAAIGHLLGSAGAVEALVTVLCLSRREVHPMPEGGETDAELGLDLVIGRPRVLPRALCAVSTSLAFGGANAAIVFRRTEPA
jgi:3-oxoacyl-[acyl-carrier-protein] synthase II